MVIFVGGNAKTSKILIQQEKISIPKETENFNIIQDFSKKYYPEFEFMVRYSKKEYGFDDFINFAQKSIQLAKEIDTPLSEEMTSNWEKTFGEKLSIFEMNMIGCFWETVASDFFGFEFQDKTSWNDWQTELSKEDIAKNILSIWIWDSFEGKTNGDKWYEIPHLKHAILFGWSIQNNSCDVMRKNVNHMRMKYGLDFEMIKDVGFFQGIAICSFWICYLLREVVGASDGQRPTIRELAISNWLYNASTRKGDVKTGQYFRDILTLSYGEKNGIWYKFGLDEKAVLYRKNNAYPDGLYRLFDNIGKEKITQVLKSLP